MSSYGERINRGWKALSEKHGVGIKISGIPPLTHLSFEGEYPLEVQTLYAQGLYEKGFLIGSGVYTTYAYTEEIIDNFIEASDFVFAHIREALDSGNLKSYLKDKVVDMRFKRLTDRT